jgi:GTPase SAR1 family protein
MQALQSSQQSLILDTITQLRKCGLDGVLSLPQLVVCGDQSAGKSSVLEALTEIPFPRNDNSCTRFATEIVLRRATTKSLTVKVVPDGTRNATDRNAIQGVSASITEFSELPSLIDKAKAIMGIGETGSRAFSKDVLSIEIEGPRHPQLTIVDLPGLIKKKQD